MNTEMKAKRNGRLSLLMGIFSILIPHFFMPVVSGILIGCYGLFLAGTYWKVDDNAYAGFMTSLLGLLADLYLLALWATVARG